MLTELQYDSAFNKAVIENNEDMLNIFNQIKKKQTEYDKVAQEKAELINFLDMQPKRIGHSIIAVLEREIKTTDKEMYKLKNDLNALYEEVEKYYNRED